jgi:fumarylacetoacetase
VLAENNPKLKSFIDVPSHSHFSIQNLPYGIFKTDRKKMPRAGVAIGEYVLDLAEIENKGFLKIANSESKNIFSNASLNAFLELGQLVWRDVRRQISKLLRHDNPILRDDKTLRERALIPMSETEMLLPIKVGDFSDFLSSEHHLNNTSKIFGNLNKPPLANWYHIPIAYHGRSSSIIVGGLPCKRPYGQFMDQNKKELVYSPTRLLDFELELGLIMGNGNVLGEPISIGSAEEHIFGVTLLNDWSARDIQFFEGFPLGPFLGKSFCTSISPWIVTLDALQPFQIPLAKQDPLPLSYLREDSSVCYDISLEVNLRTNTMTVPEKICVSNARYLYWSFVQLLVHQTSNGCNIKPGDILGTGTISGPTNDALACLLELTLNGTQPFKLNNGEQRTYLENGDEIIMAGWCEGKNYRVGFGNLSGQIIF